MEQCCRTSRLIRPNAYPFRLRHVVRCAVWEATPVRSAMSGFGETVWAALLGRQYGLSVRSVELVSVAMNITMRVDADAGEFYLRLYRERGRTRSQIDAEIRALLAFEPTQDVHVAKPQALRGGGHVFSAGHDGHERWAALFAAAPGSPPGWATAQLRQLGRALGVLHRQMARAYPAGRPFDPAAIVSEAAGDIAALGAKFRRTAALALKVGASAIAELDAAGGQLHRGLCHGDLWLGKNVHFDGGRTTFYDFDDCFDGPLAADLATFVAGLWYADLSDFPAQLRIALDAYAAAQPVRPRDIIAIPALIRLHEIRMLGFLARIRALGPDSGHGLVELFERRCAEWGRNGIATAIMRRYAAKVPGQS